MTPELSVVILCYQESRRINSFVDRTVNLLDKALIPWEIVLVANYWDDKVDDTPHEARKIAAQRNNIKAVTMLKQGKMGWDARSGLKEARGRFICLIDGDGQMPLEDIIRVYEKIKRDKLDFVMTYRVKRGDGLVRKINSYAYNLVFRILFPGVRVRDANSKPKIFTKEAYSKMRLSADDWFLDAEMLIQCARLKLKVGELAVTFDKCANRESFVRADAIFEFVKNLLRARIKEFFNKNG